MKNILWSKIDWGLCKKYISNIQNIQNELYLLLSKNSIHQYIEQVCNHLFAKWRNFNESAKNFYKKENKIDIDFRTLSTPNKKLSPIAIADIYTNLNRDLSKVKNLDIINGYTDTDFVISWIQHFFDNNINWWNKFLHQPVIRLNGDKKWKFFISWVEGIATSFINTTQYNINSNIINLINDLERFFDFLNTIWIYIGDISLKLKIKNDIWNKRDVFVFSIHIIYGNLHIWDISLINNFFDSSIQDLWFGLERINMARNKNTNYFEQYINDISILQRFNNIEIDSIKTLCLILTSWNFNLLDTDFWGQISKLFIQQISILR